MCVNIHIIIYNKDYIKIFIIRNLLYVFSSINKKCGYNCKCHSIIEFIEICKSYNYYLKNNINILYLIKYEDIFRDNFKNLKNIFNSIGFKYNNNIFKNYKFTNITDERLLTIPSKKPDEKNHLEFRTWQINQPLYNMNDDNKINLSNEQKKIY